MSAAPITAEELHDAHDRGANDPEHPPAPLDLAELARFVAESVWTDEDDEPIPVDPVSLVVGIAIGVEAMKARAGL